MRIARLWDQEDFCAEHDALFLKLLEQWPRAVKEVLDEARGTESTENPVGDLIGEPCYKGRPLLFPDAVAKGTHAGQAFAVVFEIKPAIPSLGEVLRQLRLYQERIAPTATVLLTLDTRFNLAFLAQGFKVNPDPFGVEARDQTFEDVKIRTVAERILTFLKEHTTAQTVGAIKAAVPGKDKLIAPALAYLKSSGMATFEQGPKRSQLWSPGQQPEANALDDDDLPF